MTDLDVWRELLRMAQKAEDANRHRPGYRSYCALTDQIQARLNRRLKEEWLR
ncbi:MAG TPA: hypothetical protein VIL68_01835 [Propionibacteriaceae bacterium]